MDNHEPPIYRAAYDLALGLSRYVKDCHPDYKSTLGLLLQQEVLRLEATIYHINDSDNKIKALQLALDSCYFIRMILRLALDLALLKIETSVILNLKIDEVARQLGGWKKAQSV